MERRKTVTPSPPPVSMGEASFGAVEGTAVTWLGSAGFLINCRGTLLLVDPVLSTDRDDPMRSETGMKLVHPLPVTAQGIPRADAVLYTHADEDHLASRTAEILARTGARMIGPAPVFEKLARLGVAVEQLELRRSGDRFSVGEIDVEVLPADHPWQLLDPLRFGRPFRPGDCCGYLFRTSDVNFFVTGDTRLMEEHLSVRDIDLLGLDVSPCSFHLGEQAHVLANLLPEAWLLPCHYGTYDAPPEDYAHLGNPADVLSKVKNAEERTILAAPGQAILFSDHRRIS